MVSNQLEAVVAPKHLVVDEDRGDPEHAALDGLFGVHVEPGHQLFGLRSRKCRVCIETRTLEQGVNHLRIGKISGLGPARPVHRIMILEETPLILGDEGGAQRQAGIGLHELGGIPGNRCTTQLRPMLNTRLVVRTLARPELWTRRGFLLTLGRLDQLAKLDRAIVDLDVEISKIGL